MALSEFFPYGAPELLDGAPARMARSTMTASLAVALLVVAAGAMMSRQVTRVIDPGPLEPPVFILDPNVLQPPPSVLEPTTISPPDPGATPIPVPDESMDRHDIVVPPVSTAGPVGERTTQIGPYDPSGTHDGVGPITIDPRPDEFIPVDEMPAQIRCKAPVYPDLARAAGVEGTVTVRMMLGLDGRVERAIIVPKTSIPMLDQAALDAALTCVFTPALANGHPVKVWVSQKYHFSLHSAP